MLLPPTLLDGPGKKFISMARSSWLGMSRDPDVDPAKRRKDQRLQNPNQQLEEKERERKKDRSDPVQRDGQRTAQVGHRMEKRLARENITKEPEREGDWAQKN